MRSRAFTLVELLVVITVIVVLVGMLMPALEKSIATAQRAKCLTILRAWTMGMKQYAMDARGAALWTRWDRVNFWPRRLAPYMGQPGFAVPSQPSDPARPDLGPNDGAMMANICPTVSVSVPASGWIGSMSQTWYAWGTMGAYGINMWAADYNFNDLNDKRYFQNRWDQIPGVVPFIFDCVWVDVWPDGNDLPPTANPPRGSNDSSMARLAMNRHLKSVGLGYVDGHAEAVAPGDLWMQTWNANPTRTPNYQGGYFK